jgi:TetR/AcrR family transcriptional regulator, mexJK operon transcriptional repressor
MGESAVQRLSTASILGVSSQVGPVVANGRTEHSESRRRPTRRRQEILEAAQQVFLKKGYLGASMDDIVALASVSKQTIYKEFGGKENLFTAVVNETTDPVGETFTAKARELEHTADLEKDLSELGRWFIHYLLKPEMMELRRLVIAEANHFPELGRNFYSGGPDRVTATLAESFSGLRDRGLLHFEDPLLAAYHFCWLILSIPWNKVLFCGGDVRFSEEELEYFADGGVRVFLAAHTPPS